MMRLFTASSAERALACPVSMVLPQVHEQTPDATGGSWRHRFLQLCNELGREAALKAITMEAPQELAFCEAIPLHRLPIKSGGFAVEVAIAYDPYSDTAREIGRGIDRRYEEHGLIPHREIGMTLDVVGVGEGVVYVGDHKTGWGSVTPAASNWQLIVGALGASRAYGAEVAYTAIHHLGPDGFVNVDEAVQDGPALALARAYILKRIPAIRRAFEVVEEGGPLPAVVIGPWCDYCPAKRTCPGVAGAIRHLEKMGEVSPEELASMLTPETARAALERIDLVEDVLKKVKAALKIVARTNPIPLADGKVWGPRNKVIESLDGAVVYHVLAERYGEEVARTVVEWKATKDRLGELARGVGEGESIAARARFLLGLIEEKQGIRRTMGEEFTAYRPKK